MVKLKKGILVIFFLGITCFCISQNKVQHDSISLSSKTPMVLPKAVFEGMIAQGTSLINTKRVKDVSDWVFIVRIYNTMVWNRDNLTDSADAVEFVKLFRQNLETIVSALGAGISRGMGYHSKKYNIDIGGATINSNSKYALIE